MRELPFVGAVNHVAGRHYGPVKESIPVIYKGQEIGEAVYSMGRYVFNLPTDLEEKWSSKLLAVRLHRNPVEPRPGSKVNFEIVAVVLMDALPDGE